MFSGAIWFIKITRPFTVQAKWKCVFTISIVKWIFAVVKCLKLIYRHIRMLLTLCFLEHLETKSSSALLEISRWIAQNYEKNWRISRPKNSTEWRSCRMKSTWNWSERFIFWKYYFGFRVLVSAESTQKLSDLLQWLLCNQSRSKGARNLPDKSRHDKRWDFIPYQLHFKSKATASESTLTEFRYSREATHFTGCSKYIWRTNLHSEGRSSFVLMEERNRKHRGRNRM